MMEKMTALWQRAFSPSQTIKEIGLVTLVIVLLLAANQQALAQGEGWSMPVMISTNTTSSWFSDIVVDVGGQPHVVWNSGRPTDEEQMDILMYSTLGDQGWLEPNDIAVTAYGGYTVRPAIAADKTGTLHVTFRGETTIYYTNSLASTAWNAASWAPRKRISGAGTDSAYYSDVAVDEQGGIHVVWNEGTSSGVNERWLWFGTLRGSIVYDGVSWLRRTSRDGLGDREIYAIIEDDSGVQWFGTDDGVYRFDGYTWEKPGLTGLKVNCATLDAYGRLWFGTDRGVRLYNEEAERADSKWKGQTVDNGLPANKVNALVTDSQGRVWVGTEKGLAHYDGKWTSYFPQDGLPPAEVFALAVDPEGGVWIGTGRGVSHHIGQRWETYTVESGLLSNVVTAIAAGRQGAIWFGTDRGVSRFDGQEWTSYTAGEGLVEGAVTALIVDREGIVWVGTEKGISRYDGQTWEVFEVPQGVAGQKITAIAEDRRVNVTCPSCADIFYRRSTDGGKRWSVPVNLSNSFAGSVKPQVRTGSGGSVYVTWEEGEDWYVREGYPVASAYTYSPDGGNRWAKPLTFSSRLGAPQQITLGVGQGDDLVVVWRLPEEESFYYQFSRDNGASWSRPETIPGVIAKPWESFSLDAYDAATDSAGNVHLLVLGRLYSPEEDLGLIHLLWNGSQWSSPTRLYASSDPPEWPRIDIGVGDRMYVTWFTRDEEHITESERGQYKVWVSYYQAREVLQTPVPLPTLLPTRTSATLLQETPSPTITPTPVIAPDTSGLPPGLKTESDEVGRLILALAPAVVVLLVVVALRSGWFRRRR